MSGSQHPQNRRHALNPPPVCFNCGVIGHFVVACPQPSRETPAGFAAAYASGPLPLNVHNQQLRSHNLQHLSHITELYSPVTHEYSEPINNAPSPALVRSYSALAYQPSKYLTSEPNITSSYHIPSFEPQNRLYGSSMIPSQTYVSDYQSPFITSYPSPQGQRGPLNSDTSKVNPHHGAFKSSLKQKHQAVSKFSLQYSDRSVPKTGYLNENSELSDKSKYLSNVPINRSFRNSRNVKFNRKGKSLNSQVVPYLIANKTECSIQTIADQAVATQNLMCKQKTEPKLFSGTDYRFSVLPAQQGVQELMELSEKGYEDEIWDWEYQSIFKDFLRDETVELAQPLATGFKSTPVPLFQAWSSKVPSVSRYARKDNLKEFTRSVRSSPQWSYMLEDPAFMDIKLDESLIPLEEVYAWISVRHGAINGFDETNEDFFNNAKCRKRERRDDCDDNNELFDIDDQIKDETDETVQGPLIKKQKLLLLDEHSDKEHKNTRHVRSSTTKLGTRITIPTEDGDWEIL